jgi:hypothetical protein
MPGKPTKLPSKKVMLDLAKSNQTLIDYAKVTPSNSVLTYSPLVQMLKTRKG